MFYKEDKYSVRFRGGITDPHIELADGGRESFLADLAAGELEIPTPTKHPYQTHWHPGCSDLGEHVLFEVLLNYNSFDYPSFTFSQFEDIYPLLSSPNQGSRILAYRCMRTIGLALNGWQPWFKSYVVDKEYPITEILVSYSDSLTTLLTEESDPIEASYLAEGWATLIGALFMNNSTEQGNHALDLYFEKALSLSDELATIFVVQLIKSFNNHEDVMRRIEEQPRETISKFVSLFGDYACRHIESGRYLGDDLKAYIVRFLP